LINGQNGVAIGPRALHQIDKRFTGWHVKSNETSHYNRIGRLTKGSSVADDKHGTLVL
jgi:hypothetical protein